MFRVHQSIKSRLIIAEIRLGLKPMGRGGSTWGRRFFFSAARIWLEEDHQAQHGNTTTSAAIHIAP